MNTYRYDLDLLKKAVEGSWSSETCYPPQAKEWSEKNPSLGQCAVTALVMQDYLGGDIVYFAKVHHYWIRLPNGSELDWTRDQFPGGIPFCIDRVVVRNDILEGLSATRARTADRYQLLKTRVAEKMKILELEAESVMTH